MTERSKNILALCVAVLVSLSTVEALFRVAFGVPVFHVEDFRFTKAVREAFSGIAKYDPLLGWVLNSGLRRNVGPDTAPVSFHTLDHGVRQNGDEEQIRTGGVLVSGASFAAGSEVSNENAFPAYLEKLIGKPVVNASVGGFGVDQIALRAEQMLPIVKPQILILDVGLGSLHYAAFSTAGYPKPFFTIEDGKLALHNTPVPTHAPDEDRFAELKNALGYSFAVDRIMATFFPDYWYSEHGKTVTRVANDPAAISCLLLDRVKRKAGETSTRMLLSIPYGGSEITSWKKPPLEIEAMKDCAVKLDIPVVDEFEAMKALLDADPTTFDSQYVLHPGHVFGHKSGAGNLEAAKRIAAVLLRGLPGSESVSKTESDKSELAQKTATKSGAKVLKDD